MPQLEEKDQTNESTEKLSRKKKDKKRKKRSHDCEMETEMDDSEYLLKSNDEEATNESSGKEGGSDNKDERRQARKEERLARRQEKDELLEKVPKVDEHGIAYTKLQIKRMLKRVKQGLNPIPTEAEERERLRNEAQLRREEQAELAGLIFTKNENGEDTGDESSVVKEEGNRDDDSNREGEEDNTDDAKDKGGEQETIAQSEQVPPKKKTKRSKPVPRDYTCMACSNRHSPIHWIYDCPDKKTMKGINNKKKKERGLHEPDSRKVFLSGLPFEIKPDSVAQLFQDCGKMVSCKLLKFKDTGRCNGQAYVSFETDEAASKALKLSGTMIDNIADDDKKKKKSKESATSNKRPQLKLKISRVLNRRKTQKMFGGKKGQS